MRGGGVVLRANTARAGVENIFLVVACVVRSCCEMLMRFYQTLTCSLAALMIFWVAGVVTLQLSAATKVIDPSEGDKGRAWFPF